MAEKIGTNHSKVQIVKNRFIFRTCISRSRSLGDRARHCEKDAWENCDDWISGFEGHKCLKSLENIRFMSMIID